MTLTSFTKPTDEPVEVKILADTVCHPHGAVSKGDVLMVSFGEYYTLKAAGKAAKVDPDAKVPAHEPSPADGMSPEEFADRLDGMSKADLVEMGNVKLGLALNAKSNKDDLIAAILAAVEK